MQNKWLIALGAVVMGMTGLRAEATQHIAGDSTFTIHGNLPGAPDGATVFLSNPNFSRDTFAKAQVHGGQFVLTGVLKDPNLYFISESGAPQHRLLFLDASQITLDASSNNLDQAKVIGSATNAEFEKFEPQFAPLFNRLGELAQQLNAQRGAPTFDSLYTIYRVKLDSLDAEAAAYVGAHAASHISSFLLAAHMQVRQDYDWLETRYDLLTPAVQGDFYGRLLAAAIAKAKIGKEGSMAMDFTQPDVNGKPVTLSSFKGKYVLVDFWASWCMPCRMENPNVVKAFAAFKDKNFTILSISLDKEKDPWLKAIAADGLTWTQVSDLQFWNNAAAQLYNISSIPQNMLIDPNGKIIAKNLRGYELLAKLQSVLK
jgi:peroxiredoxin